MAWKVIKELQDMMKVQKTQEEIDDRLVEAQIREQRVRDYFNNQIHTYLRTNKKGMGQLDLSDYEKMTKNYNTKQKQVFMEQLLKAMQTNRGKPIKRIKENNKSVLLNQIDD